MEDSASSPRSGAPSVTGCSPSAVDRGMGSVSESRGASATRGGGSYTSTDRSESINDSARASRMSSALKPLKISQSGVVTPIPMVGKPMVPADLSLEGQESRPGWQITRMLKIIIVLLTVMIVFGLGLGLGLGIGLNHNKNDDKSSGDGGVTKIISTDVAGNISIITILHDDTIEATPLARWVVDGSRGQGLDDARAQAKALREAFRNPAEMQIIFREWARKYHKSDEYDRDQAEEAFSTFQENLKSIMMANADVRSSFTTGVNDYSGLSIRDLEKGDKALLMRINPEDYDEGEDGAEARTGRKLTGLPRSVDWVAAGKTTAVKNQGLCGSCWVASAVSAIESVVLITYGITSTPSMKLISMQEILDCATPGNGYANAGGCAGGVIPASMDFAFRHGVIKDTLLPYTATSDPARCPTQYMNEGWEAPRLRPSNGVALTFQGASVQRYSKAALMEAVAQQPVAVYIRVIFSFVMYNSGIFNPSDCVGSLNHAVVVVGYNNDSKNPYWILQNSWGPSWGDAGYMKIAMDADGYGRCMMYSLPGYYARQSFDAYPTEWVSSGRKLI